MDSNIKASYFCKSATLDGSTHLLNFEIIQTKVEMLSEADDVFLHVHLDHAAAEITVASLHDNFWVNHLVAKFELCKNLSKQQRCKENVCSKTAG